MLHANEVLRLLNEGVHKMGLSRIALLVTVLMVLVLALSACSPTTTTPTTTTPTTTTPTTTTPTTTTPTTTTPTTTTPGVYEIHVFRDMVYVPASITVPVGSTVIWILVGGPDPEHPLGWSPYLDLSVTFSGEDTHLSYTFTMPGTYNYHCDIHGDFGIVIVD